MRPDSPNWLDALTDGQMFRDWLSLVANFFFSIGYLIFLIAGYSTAISLIPVLVGIPLLLFMLASTRALAAADYQVMATILQADLPPVEDDVDASGANLGHRFGLYFGSMTTWRSLLYLLVKFPIGLVSSLIAIFAVPILFVELLILAPLTIDMRLASVRLLHFLANGLNWTNNLFLPTGSGKRTSIAREEFAAREQAASARRKRSARRLELDNEDERPYALEDLLPQRLVGDDGELEGVKPKRRR
jgi:putative sensor protein